MKQYLRYIIKNTVLALAVTLASSLPAEAQQIRAALSHYSTDDGLCSNAVSDIQQDGYGYIWVATWNGLSRFDGFSFYNYKTGGQSRVPLLHNRILDMKIDGMQNVWMRMYDNRVFVLQRSTDRIINPFKDVSGYKELRSSHKLTATHNGDILIIIDGVGIYRMHSTRDSISKRLISTEKYNITSIVEGYKDDMWVGTNKGIHQLNTSNEQIDNVGIMENESITCMFSNGYNIYAGTESGKVVECAYGEDPNILLDTGVSLRTIYKDSNGHLWFATDKQGISRLDATTGLIKDYQQVVTVPEYDQHTAMVTEIGGRIWVNMNHGGFGYYNRETDEIEYFHNNPLNTWELSNTLTSFLALQEGVIWEATSRKGLDKLEILKKTIRHFPFFETGGDQSINETRALYHDAKRKITIMGNKKGCLKITDGFNHHYINDVGGTGDFGRVYGIDRDSKGNYWISTKGTGLIRMTPTANGYQYKRYRTIANHPMWLNNENVYCTVEDKQGNIWIATYGGGVNILTKDAKGREVIVNCNNSIRHYPNNEYQKVRTLALDKRGRVWAGTTDGIIIMWKNGNRINFQRVEDNEEVEYNLNSKDIIVLKCDSKGTMWVGTNGGGLSHCLNTDANEDYHFETLGNAEGLPSEEIKSITFEKNDNLWFATDHVLCSYDKQRKVLSTYTIQDGVDDCICSEGAAITTARGNIIFGTQKGYYVVDKKKLTGAGGLFLKLQLTDFYYNDELQSPRLSDKFSHYVPDSKEVRMPDHSCRFAFRFASLNYQLQHRVHYQYLLEGYDSHWQTATKERMATYENIPTGTYKFRVRASLIESPEKFDERVITVVIPPTFLLSTSAIWIYIVLVVLGGVAYLLWKQKRLAEELDANGHNTADRNDNGNASAADGNASAADGNASAADGDASASDGNASAADSNGAAQETGADADDVIVIDADDIIVVEDEDANKS